MGIYITQYDAMCNLGNNIGEIFSNAIIGNNSKFVQYKYGNKTTNVGIIDCETQTIKNPDYNIRANQLVLKLTENIDIQSLLDKYSANRIGIVGSTTNTGVEEYEYSKNLKHIQINNTADFLRKEFGLNNFCTTVSTACSSGLKAFSVARDLLNSNFSDAVIVISADTLAKVPVYGFDSLEILSHDYSNPFGENRTGINIGEGVVIFILEKEQKGIEVSGIGETTDIYHSTTPEPAGTDAQKAILNAIKEACISLNDIDYINLHGTGTMANDFMEANVISKIFGSKILVSSTKPLTGHCLGASASVETALCCELIKRKSTKVYPHIIHSEFDKNLPRLNFASKDNSCSPVKTCLSTSFGFGGTNCAIILG